MPFHDDPSRWARPVAPERTLASVDLPGRQRVLLEAERALNGEPGSAAIAGPAGVGKGTVAREPAQRLAASPPRRLAASPPRRLGLERLRGGLGRGDRRAALHRRARGAPGGARAGRRPRAVAAARPAGGAVGGDLPREPERPARPARADARGRAPAAARAVHPGRVGGGGRRPPRDPDAARPAPARAGRRRGHARPRARRAARHARAGAPARARAFDGIAARFADGRPYLFGERFTAADLTFSALAAAAVVPPGYGTPLPQLDVLPEPVARDVRAFREHPAGAFALRIYERHRRAAAA